MIAHQWETRPIGSETLIDCVLHVLHAHIHVRYDICHQSSRHTLQGNVHTIQSTGQAPPVSLWQRRGTVAVVYGSCAVAGIAVAAAWYGRFRV